MARWMRCFVVVFLSLPAPMFSAPTDWTAAIKKLEGAVMQISDTCSAFAIDDDKDLAVTAKHCTSEDLTKPTVVDLIPSRVIADDVQFDLTVLHVPGMDKEPLVLAADDPLLGTEAVSLGYGYGFKRPMLRFFHVSNRKVTVTDLDGEWVIFDGPFVGGMSGSPVVNAAGDIVAVVQMTSDRMGLGRGADIVKSRIGKHFPKPKP